MRKVNFIFLSIIFVLSLVFPFAKILAANPYDYQLISQSPYPSTLKSGETTNVWIEIKNTGTEIWRNSGINPVRLGSGSQYGSYSQQRDYKSEFANSDWLSSNRPSVISKEVVFSGETARFQFNIKAPTTAGIYKAYFTPVVDGISWMKDMGIYWEITVVPTLAQSNGNTTVQNDTQVATPAPNTISNNTSVAANSPLGPSAIQKKFSSSVVKVICGDNNGLSGFGSGTLFYDSINSKSIIMTNLHVVKQESGDTPRCIIQLFRDTTNPGSYILYKTYNYKLLSNSIDFAVLDPQLMTQSDFSPTGYYYNMGVWYNILIGYSLDMNYLRAGNTSQLHDYSLDINTAIGNTANIGDGVYIIGYPYVEGANSTITSGSVTGFDNYGGVKYLVTNAKVNSGVSGGLALNEYGKIIGIPSMLQVTTQGNIGYILYLNDILNKVVQ